MSGEPAQSELHPIVAQMRPSCEQRPAVLARGGDIVVTAGAGTGKTRTLVARYLSLLAQGLPLRSIVAITFTKKAAREMRNRVRDEMRRYLEQVSMDRAEYQRWLRLYGELDAARIGTIHHLCTEILRAHPAEAQVDPRFDVLEEGQVAILRRRAMEGALAWAADDLRAVSLFGLLGERELQDTLARLMAQRLEVAESLRRMPEDIRAHWQQALAGRQQEVLAALLGEPAWQEALETLHETRALHRDDLLEAQRREVLAAIDAAVGPLADCLSSLSCLGTIRLNVGSARAWPGGAGQMAGVKAALRTLRYLWESRAEPLQLNLNRQDEALAQAFPALAGLFSCASGHYEAFKVERNALDFDDLEHRALALLQRDAAVLARWQGEVQAVLVDEFQDTNGRQRELVALLNGGRGCLFIVGDGKQSIYRFRGADVSVFRAERGRVLRQGGAVLALETSYRAHRALIEALNDLLRPVLGEEPDPDRAWVEPFAPLRHHRELPGRGFSPPHIELHLAVGTKAAGALDRAADALVLRLVGLKQNCAVEGRPGGLDYGDIAILCRASSSFTHYENALDRAGVPFLTVAGRGFYDRPEVRDILNALRALADPSDDLALAGLLRSPAMTLSDCAIYLLCQERPSHGGRGSLWEVLRRGGTGLSGEDVPRAARAAQAIAALHDQVGRVSVADLLKAFLDGTDYRAALLQAGQARAARNVAKLLADAHASSIVGVGEFLQYISGLRGIGAREGEARATAEGAVQIMSVHAAKGLEFPVVVLGDVTYSGGRRSAVLVDPELGVLLPIKGGDGALPAAYCLGRARADDQGSAEEDRLLYVAATRAAEKLIFSGCIVLRQDGAPARLGGWLGRIAAVVGLEGRRVERDAEGSGTCQLDLQVGHATVGCTLYGPHWAPPASSQEIAVQPAPPLSPPPPLLAPVAPGVAHVDGRTAERERTPPQRVWRVVPAVRHPTAPAWVIGSLVHEALAAWRFPDGESFPGWAGARTREYGMTDSKQIADAIGQAGRLLRRFQAHWLFRDMDGAERRLHEVPYSRLVDGRLESGIIDALYLREGVWTLVEFKTDRVDNEADLESVLARDDHRAQVERYARAVQRLVGQRPRVVLCLLNYAGTVRLI